MSEEVSCLLVAAQVIPVSSLRVGFLVPNVRELVLIELQHLLKSGEVRRFGFAAGEGHRCRLLRPNV